MSSTTQTVPQSVSKGMYPMGGSFQMRKYVSEFVEARRQIFLAYTAETMIFATGLTRPISMLRKSLRYLMSFLGRSLNQQLLYWITPRRTEPRKPGQCLISGSVADCTCFSCHRIVRNSTLSSDCGKRLRKDGLNLKTMTQQTNCSMPFGLSAPQSAKS